MKASGARTFGNDDSLLIGLGQMFNSNIIPFRTPLIDGKHADTKPDLTILATFIVPGIRRLIVFFLPSLRRWALVRIARRL